MKLFLFLSILCLISCHEACLQKDTALKKENFKPELSEEKIPQLPSFSELNLADLSQEKIAVLSKVFNNEICPCGCPKSFAQCLEMPQGCKAGIILAQWAADQLKAGHPERFVLQGLSEEINAGYLVSPLPVKTSGAYQKGNKKAPIIIVEFADFECPACKVAHQAVEDLLKNNEQKVQLYFMHFPLTAHPYAEKAAVAAEAAGLLGKFWQMHDLLFKSDKPLSDEQIILLAQKIFAKDQLKKFRKNLKKEALLKKVRAQREHAMNDLKLMGTPAFLFNGRPYNLALTESGLKLRLEMELLRSSINCRIDGK